MEKENMTPRLAPVTKDSDWYVANGWRVFNNLLTDLAASHLDIVWIENFEAVRKSLNCVNRKALIQRFNADSLDWQMKTDADGTLYLCRNN